MIKIFGKIRYHWQPELSWAIIYWSVSFTPIFMALALVYEKARISNVIVSLFVIFIILFGIGLHRYFEIREDYLLIASANPFATRKMMITDIHKVEVNYLSITLFSIDKPKGKVYHMRKWPKKYFVNALTLHQEFEGEIVLVDHLIKLDYFEEYYAKKAKSI